MADFYCVKCDSDREQDCHCYDDEYVPPPSPRKVLSDQSIQDLWGIGFTIVPRVDSAKVYDLAAGAAPAGMVYQWNDGSTVNGWKNVPASRHPGMFAPYCVTGDIEVSGLWLMERPKAEVDAFHTAAHAKALQNVDDWYERTAALGFTGSVTVLSEGSDIVREIGTKTIEDATKIPRELTPYIGQIFAMRDELWKTADRWWGKPTPEYEEYERLAAANPEWSRGQIMNAVLTSIAIENTRKWLNERAQHDKSTDGGSAGNAEPGTQAAWPAPDEGTSG